MKKISKFLFSSMLFALLLTSCGQSIPGPAGKDGLTPYIGNDGNWWIGTTNTGIPAQGPQGNPGQPGQPGTPGTDGDPGEDGVSVESIVKIGSEGLIDTYQINYSDGSSTTFTVTNGKDGTNPTITIGDDGCWVINGVNTGKPSQGADGQDGDPGEPGTPGSDGEDGEDGKSAFEIYKETYGYEGTEAEWINDLVNNNLGAYDKYTVSFVSNFSITIPQVQVKKGYPLSREDIDLPEGYGFPHSYGDAYFVPANKTFDGDFSDLEPWSFIGYGVYQNMTLALDLRGPIDDVTNEKMVNLYGRNLIGDHQVTFYNAGSGFEVAFNGTELKGVFDREQITGTPSSGKSNIKLRVYVDGDMDINHSTIVVLDSTTDNNEVTLIDGLSNGEHKVLVRKANYEDRGAVVLKALSGPNFFSYAPSKPNKKILFYGDSLTVGYGVNYLKDDTVPEGTNVDTWDKEDNGKSYATLTTDYFGAEYMEMCVSGISLGIPSWREFTWLDRWDKYSYFSNQTCPKETLLNYQPDLIIINLGTNDEVGMNGGGVYGHGSAYEAALIAQGKLEPQGYTMWNIYSNFYNLIVKLHELYPNATFIGSTGMTSRNDTTYTMFETAKTDLAEKRGITDVHILHYNSVEVSTCAGHPTEIGQRDAFEQLKQYITENNLL